MSARDVALAWLHTQLGAPVLMGYRGDLRFDRELRRLVPHDLGLLAWDCSGSVGGAVKAAGGPDLRGTMNAQMFHDQMRALEAGEKPLPGDCGFFGSSKLDVFHIVTIKEVDELGVITSLISADGATWRITDLQTARAKGCMVREHDRLLYRGDAKYVAVRRNIFLDRLDGVDR